MKCASCSGKLEGTMTFCPYCGVRQDIDLRQIHFRDMGKVDNLPCPSCGELLGVIEFETDPPIRIERCGSCHGMFFNPGELEALLDAQTNQVIWLDLQQLEQIAADFGYQHEVVYRCCPMCGERMSHLNFARSSGVVLDRCGTHGVWAEGGELRRLVEWWRAGGKHIHQQAETERAAGLYGRQVVRSNSMLQAGEPVEIESSRETSGEWNSFGSWNEVIRSLASLFMR